jgi:tryptophan halogenase
VKIVIAGSGTAGLISAIYLKQAFPSFDIEVISSSSIGIIGVGEGSTEHWKSFQDYCGIDPVDMILKTDATYKLGIKFEGWTKSIDSYFHSVNSLGALHKGSFIPSYAESVLKNELLTHRFSSLGIEKNMIDADKDYPYHNNQYHFDTFKVNEYFVNIAKQRGISFIDDEIVDIKRDSESGFITSVCLKNNKDISGDFFIDASGFKRILMSNFENQEFASYSEYLPCDSAIAFPTESDPSGEIRPYTRAIAMNSGWRWEIPTQKRRGNGYVFCSRYSSETDAVDELSKTFAREIIPARSFKFEPGYYKKTWQFNCVAIGLSAAFVEPLEATSISTTIQQVMILSSHLSTFNKNTKFGIDEYHKHIDSVMENILAMISMHYISDRRDTAMWSEQVHMKKPDLVQRLLGLWQERLPEAQDIPRTGFELFHVYHFYHVAQGQGLINLNNADAQLTAYDSKKIINNWYNTFNHARGLKRLVDHGTALRGLYGRNR